ncbi:hypothetical protein D3OALGA1CA_5427 [Olavius algarvensis associated proteobacterium Delta 3]|nr:hypothetical protein D3OALGB2SA_3719 [Olavius algarvensis associated proteobacterium Delta 3]CAB5166788.1 hypothetical protein D3OALGA1CA_5427 [Olavius algarvensis associated proteobacterium Delta 3]
MIAKSAIDCIPTSCHHCRKGRAVIRNTAIGLFVQEDNPYRI